MVISYLLTECQNFHNAALGPDLPHPLSGLTYGFRKPINPLAVGVGLVPDVGVGQVGRGVEPLLEEVALHRHHQVNLEQPHRHHRRGHGDLEQRAVALSPGAEVAELQAGARNLDLLVQHLQDKETR